MKIAFTTTGTRLVALAVAIDDPNENVTKVTYDGCSILKKIPVRCDCN